MNILDRLIPQDGAPLGYSAFLHALYALLEEMRATATDDSYDNATVKAVELSKQGCSMQYVAAQLTNRYDFPFGHALLITSAAMALAAQGSKPNPP